MAATSSKISYRKPSSAALPVALLGQGEGLHHDRQGTGKHKLRLGRTYERPGGIMKKISWKCGPGNQCLARITKKKKEEEEEEEEETRQR
ncbi:uncharacterized protein IUM83_07763 [Phytophthora cinnamomi]|uniref:uncharacterized protein n=1 Tax=Phytophthora cinnamomi TaxID=4785 RepID=UPI00355A1418|nr:hypothetical protein IUM83_07763 [Phytophthora cinnamomi]